MKNMGKFIKASYCLVPNGVMLQLVETSPCSENHNLRVADSDRNQPRWHRAVVCHGSETSGFVEFANDMQHKYVELI